jgi:hypothetical protein
MRGREHTRVKDSRGFILDLDSHRTTYLTTAPAIGRVESVEDIL